MVRGCAILALFLTFTTPQTFLGADSPEPAAMNPLRHDVKAARWQALKDGKVCVVILNTDHVLIHGKLRDIDPALEHSKGLRPLFDRAIVISVRAGEEGDELRKELNAGDDVVIFNEDGDMHAVFPVVETRNDDGELLANFGVVLAGRLEQCLPLPALKDAEQKWRAHLDSADAWEALVQAYVKQQRFDRLPATYRAATWGKPPAQPVAELFRMYSYLVHRQDPASEPPDVLAEAQQILCDLPTHALAQRVADSLPGLKLPLNETVAKLRVFAQHGTPSVRKKYETLAASIEFASGDERTGIGDKNADLKTTMFDAEAAEKSGELGKAVAAYEEALKHAGGETQPRIEEALKRLKTDPSLHEPEARRGLSLAANYLLNDAKEPARKAFEDVIRKYPETAAAREARKKLAEFGPADPPAQANAPMISTAPLTSPKK